MNQTVEEEGEEEEGEEGREGEVVPRLRRP